MTTTMSGDELRCFNCGGTYKINLPASLRVAAAAMEAFAKDHANCKPSEAGAAKMKYSTPAEWRSSWDTGRSSLTIYGVMVGRPYHDPSVPLDPADFGRCYRLLKAFPEWRARISEVAEMYEAWKDLVRNWERLEFLYEQELPSGNAPQLYACIQRCTRPAPTRIPGSGIPTTR